MVTSMRLLTVTILLCCSQSIALEYLLPERDARSVSSGDSDCNDIQQNDSLHNVLSALQNDCSLVLSSGQYQLEQYILVSNLTNVRISGQNKTVVISCNENVGLAFINVTGLVIEDVRIEGCGLSGTNLDLAVSEIRQFIDLFLVVYSEMRVALLLAHCENLQMNRVELYNNVGFGVVGVNIIGTSVISQLTAVNNSQLSDCQMPFTYNNTLYDIFQDPDRYSGGAVFIYHDYLSELHSNQSILLTIENGMFKNNTECSLNANIYAHYNEPEYYRNLGYRIGGGGGLTLMMAQLNYGIQVTTQDTMFVQNEANVGSGAHVAMFSGTKNTAIEFMNCDFLSNGVSPESPSLIQFRGGAGLAVITDFGGPLIERARSSNIANILNTSIRIENSRFSNNSSPIGAGLFYYSLYKSDIKDAVHIFIQNSTFQGNTASAGSAMLVSELKYHAAYVGTQVEVIDTNITENKIVSANFEGAQSVQHNSGTINLRNMNMTLKGNCFVDKNLGTGLKAESSYVGIDGNVTFSENVGIRGGAMFLATYTWLIVLPNASLYLLNNTARDAGGAVYSIFPDIASITGGMTAYSDCFLAFSFNNFGPCVNCSDFNKTGSFIKFEGNSAPVGSLVYGSSFQTCFWKIDLFKILNMPLFNDPELIFNLLVQEFPTVFSFNVPAISPEYFQTQAEGLSAEGPNNTTEFNMLPGQVFHVNFSAYDGFNQIVSNVISSFVQTESLESIPNATAKIGQNNHGLLHDNRSTELPMSVTGEQGQDLSVVIYSIDSIGVARTTINVSLRHCGLGYMLNNTSLGCVCRPELKRLGVTCDKQSLELIKDQDNLWIGPVDGDLLGVVHCPLQHCDESTNTIPLVEGLLNFDAQCDPNLYRRGVACGYCQEGRSQVLGTDRCLVCTNTSILLILLFPVLGLLLILSIYFLDITITTGLLNGAIFFSNFVTLYGIFVFGEKGYNNFTAFIYFLSLNFGFEACLYDGMEAIGRLLLHFSFPIYLFLLILGIVLLASCCKTPKIVQSLRGLSIVRAISTLLVLCYVSILQITAQLYSFTEIHTVDEGTRIIWFLQPSSNYFEDAHILLLILAIFLSFYLVLFPCFLLLPCLVYKSRRLSKYKPIYDSFWYPFKPKYQWWLGFRLIYRWVPFLLAFLVPAPINLFVTDLLLILLLFLQLQLRPFKNSWINLFDSVFIGMLVVMFTGTQFFKANEKMDSENAVIVIFNLTIAALGLIMFIGILVYHIIIRFEKLKTLVLKACSKVQALLFKKKFTPQENNDIPLRGIEENNLKWVFLHD